MIDLLLLLSEGNTMYYGHARDAVEYFSNLRYICPNHFNPADYFLDLVSLDTRSTELEESTGQVINYLSCQFQISKQSNMMYKGDASNFQRENDIVKDIEMSSSIEESKTCEVMEFGVIPMENVHEIGLRLAFSDLLEYFKSWFLSFYILFWRANAEIYRNYGALLIRTMTSLFFAVILSLIYHDISYSQRNIQDRIGVLYFLMVNQVRCWQVSFV
jgi:hypothetical protein